MSHYTLSWHDQQTKYQICEYANDAFEAVRNAREDVPYLHEHPFSLEKIGKNPKGGLMKEFIHWTNRCMVIAILVLSCVFLGGTAYATKS